MSFSQVRFLGASVRGCSASVGWNLAQTSTLNVQLVEDALAGDSFDPPEVGTPVYFELGSFRFGGLLQKYEKRNEAQGLPTYDVTCVDPREILDGASLILGGYSGSVGDVRNLINAYGHWEALGFGASLSSETGMPWTKVRDAVLSLVNQPSYLTYGGPLTYRGIKYGLNLSELPSPPEGYRIGGGVSASLLEVIAGICDDGGCDFFVELDGLSIKVRTVSRKRQPPLGTIAAIADTNWGGSVVRSSAGVESRNETTSAFLVGGEVADLYLTDSITSFWGYDALGAPILGRSSRVDLTDDRFTGKVTTGFSATATTVKLGDWRKTVNQRWPATPHYVLIGNEILQLVSSPAPGSYGVKRGQLNSTATQHDAGQKVRVLWHSLTCDVMSLNATPVADALGLLSYPTSELELRLAKVNFESWAAYLTHYRRDVAGRLGLLAPFKNLGGIGRIVKAALLNDAKADAKAMAQGAVLGDRWARQMRVYEFIRGYADEYMGRRYAVGLPFVLSRQDPETLRISFSYDVVDGGYLPEGSAPLGLSGLNEDVFKTPDGRFRCFALFDELLDVDLSGVSPHGSVVEGGSLFLEAQVETQVVFTPTPAAIVTLSSPLTKQAPDTAGGLEVVAAVLQRAPADAQELLKRAQFGNVGVRVQPEARPPAAIAVPLKSNTLTYGPWYRAGAAGKVRFESDPGLTPWNYGGYAAMNAAALSRVVESVTDMQQSEAGSLELAGLPTVSLGGVLESGGPTVTNVQIGFGPQGVSTTYSFATYTPRFGVFSKGSAERLKRLSLAGMELRRSFRTAVKEQGATRNAVADARRAARAFMQAAPAAVRKQTPHECLISYSVRETGVVDSSEPGEETTEDRGVRLGVSTATSEEAVAFANADSDEDYQGTAVASWSAVVRPYSTQAGFAGPMPGLSTPSGGFDSLLSSTSLDHWGDDNDVELYAHGDTYEGVCAQRDGAASEQARVFGLRGPVVVAGWGHDSDGLPVPGGTGGFPDSYRKRSNLWKAGPIDLLWDDWRGVWSCRDGLAGAAEEDVGAGNYGAIRVYSGATETDRVVTATNWSSIDLEEGDLVHLLFDPVGMRWLAFAIKPPTLPPTYELPTGDPYTVLHRPATGDPCWHGNPTIHGIRLGGEGIGLGVLDMADASGARTQVLPSYRDEELSLVLPPGFPATGDCLVVSSFADGQANLTFGASAHAVFESGNLHPEYQLVAINSDGSASGGAIRRLVADSDYSVAFTIDGPAATLRVDEFAASGPLARRGLVPAPPLDAGSTRYLREDGGWQELSFGAPTGVGWTNAEGSSGEAARADHVHAHGVFESGNLHPEYQLVVANSDGSASGSAVRVLLADPDWAVSFSIDGSTATLSAAEFVQSGASAKRGLVPTPPGVAGETKFLCENGQWQTPSSDALPSGDPYTVLHRGTGDAHWSRLPHISGVRLGGPEVGDGVVDLAPEAAGGRTRLWASVRGGGIDLFLPSGDPVAGDFLRVESWDGATGVLGFVKGLTTEFEYVGSGHCDENGLVLSYGKMWFADGILVDHSGAT